MRIKGRRASPFIARRSSMFEQDVDETSKVQKTRRKKKPLYVVKKSFDLLVIDKRITHQESEIVTLEKKYADVLIDRGYLEIK